MNKEKEQIENTLVKVQEVVELFYQQSDKEAFEMFTGVLENMATAIDNLAIYKSENPGFEMDEQKIAEILKDAMDALQSEDKVLMADILQYDFIEYINELMDKM